MCLIKKEYFYEYIYIYSFRVYNAESVMRSVVPVSYAQLVITPNDNNPKHYCKLLHAEVQTQNVSHGKQGKRIIEEKKKKIQK